MSKASSFVEMKAVNSRRVVPFTGLEQFGLVLFCRSITEKESAELESDAWKPGTIEIDPIRLKRARRKMLAATVCDEEGNRLLTEDQAAELDSVLASVLYDQAKEHTSLGKLKKNSLPANDGPTPSDSPPNVDATTSTSSSTN